MTPELLGWQFEKYEIMAMINLSSSNKLARSLDFAGYLWILPVIYYFYTLGAFVTNTPYADDINEMVGNTTRFLEAKNFREALPHLFMQGAEYRTTFVALSGIISTKLFGYIDFNLITLMGNIALFFAIFIISLGVSKNASELRLFALISCLLMSSPIYLECALWANCTIGHFNSIFAGSLLSLLLIRSGIVPFILFEAGFIVTIFLLGTAVVMVPVGLLGIWLFQEKRLRNLLLAIHAIMGAALLITWKITVNSDTTDTMSGLLVQASQTPLQSLIGLMTWVVGWIGSWATFKNSVLTAVIAGSMEIAFLVYVFIWKREIVIRHYPHLVMMIAFMLVTIAGAAALRSYGIADTQQIFADRFRIHSLVLAICLVLLLLVLLRDKLIPTRMLACHWHYPLLLILLYCIYYNVRVNTDKQPDFVAYKNQRLICTELWARTGEAKPCLWHGDNKILMDKAVQMGILYIDKNGSEPLRCKEPYLKYCWK